ncbi:MAG TPA: TlpA disulfide reductase family protein [Pyrinomonadaceae bacterium]|nr:TlpA disulfide reductase family protein [Pyrinomonadaceae bacterium]
MRKLLLMTVALLFVCGAARAQSQSGGASKTAAGAQVIAGQVVCCAECWAEADRRTVPYGTAADLEKAKSCVAGGDPTLLAVMDATGATKFYELVRGKFKPEGSNWLAFVGKHVSVTGKTGSKKDKSFVKVDALKVLPTPPGQAPAQDVDAVGREAELVLKDLTGTEQRLSAYRGRVVVLNFWATYCAPCRKEMPDLAAVQNAYAALGVQVVGASAETFDERAKILQFVRETGVNFPVWVGATTADMARFGLGPALPGTAIVGRDGRVVWATRGVVSEADLRSRLDALIEAAEREAEARAAEEAKAREAAQGNAEKDASADASSVPS